MLLLDGTQTKASTLIELKGGKKMKTQHLLSILLLCLILSSPGLVQAWNLYGISGDVVSGKTFILLTWPRDSTVAGFNLYRKESATEPYPAEPLNREPLSVMTDCNQIKNTIGYASAEWEKIALVLSDSVIFDPCRIASIPDTTQKFERLQALAHAYWKIGVIIGQAYADSAVTVGKTYWYEIRGVNKTGTEIGVLDTDVQVTAGMYSPLPVPPGFSAEPGDAKVQLTWDEMDDALGFDIQRKTSTTPAVKINESITVAQCITDLAGDTIPMKNCFIDFQRWDTTTGDPIKHFVAGDSIDGPYNGTTYKYRVRALDILRRSGAWSSWVNATPQDSTPPAVPQSVSVTPYVDGLETKWLKVTYDAEGHKELEGVEGYHLYRFQSPDTLGDSIQVATLIPHPSDTAVQFVVYKDTDPNLRSDYGEKDYWYRVKAVDSAGNTSSLSPAAGGHLPDTTPPLPPSHLDATGFADHITLDWERPSPVPPDLAGYMIYRGICGGDSVCAESVCVGSLFVRETQTWVCTLWKCTEKEFRIYPLHPIANIDDPDTLQYGDYSVPLDAPICYRYAVKAYDRSQNLSDTSGTICERLREGTPPPPPIISGLKARDRAIKVEWIAPPVQDLFGFIIERAESETGPWIQVSDTLDFPTSFGCEDIPATNIWAADSIFSFYDTTVVPKKTYWYRVRGADYGKNIGDPSVPIETYTYSITGPPQPTGVSVNQVPGECAIRINWNPTYDTTYLGFAIFRSSSADQGYRQVSPIIQDNEYIDNTIVAEKEYWYKVQYFGKDGNRSPVSDPKNGMATP